MISTSRTSDFQISGSAISSHKNIQLFLSYFPAIVQGPISKYDQLSPQLLAGKRSSFHEFRSNGLLVVFGMIKKIVIADQLAVFANYCFTNYMDLHGVILYIGALCYTFQLYMDFSGCVDICRGVSGMFGIELIDNFNAPYFSKSIKEFWRRWHISLSTWLKDYVYISMGGNKKGTLRKYLNMILTFFVSGIWHGEGFNFIFWGLLQAFYQIIGECTYEMRKKMKKAINVEEGSWSDNVYRTIITFHLTVLSWIFFRSNGLMSAIVYLKNMVSDAQLWVLFDGSLFIHGINLNQTIVLISNLILILLVEYLELKRKMNIRNSILKTHIVLRWAIYLVLFFDIVFWGAYGSGYDMAGFLYGGF